MISFLSPWMPCSWSACPSLGIYLSCCSVSLVSKQLNVSALLNRSIFFFQIWQPFKITLSIPFHSSLFPVFVLYILVSESSLLRSSSDLWTKSRGGFLVFPTPKHPATFTATNFSLSSLLHCFSWGIIFLARLSPLTVLFSPVFGCSLLISLKPWASTFTSIHVTLNYKVPTRHFRTIGSLLL